MTFGEFFAGTKISHNALSQVVALGSYALSDAYIEEVRSNARIEANLARSYREDSKQSEFTIEAAQKCADDAAFGFRLASDLEAAAKDPEIVRRVQHVMPLHCACQ